MNDSLRWLLVLGCLSIVFLEAPQDLLQILQDSSGAYPAQASNAELSASSKTPTPFRTRIAGGIEASSIEASSPSVAFTELEIEANPLRFPTPAAVTHSNRRPEEDRAHEPRDDRTEFRAEFATGR